MEYDNYDIEGLPIKKFGNRRPNIRTVVCQECKNKTKKVRYGTFECLECKLVYQFKYGKIEKGRICCDYSQRQKKYIWSYEFLI